MGNMIFKIIMFSICLNFATGLMIQVLPDIGNNPQYNPNVKSYNQDNQGFVSGMNKTIDPTPDTSNTFFRLIDSLNIGLITKLLNTINLYLYGFIEFMGLIFSIDSAIVVIFKTMLTVSYIIGAFWLWTGKNIIG